MRDKTFRRRNHYVPEFLLKNFSAIPSGAHLWEYRLLVEDARVPEWDWRPASHLARTSDLYTIAESTDESDQMERWLDEEFESPAKDAVLDAIAGKRLNRMQWRRLIGLYASQFLRTPAYYVRHKEQWAAEMQRDLLEMRDHMLTHLPKCKDIDSDFNVVVGENGFPLRCTIRREEGLRRSIHIQHVTGRKFWVWAIRQGLRPTGVLSDLEQYRWSILNAPVDFQWFLTDNPAVCIRRRADGTQTLDGGWGALDSKLMLPLSPKHLLYCHVGADAGEQYPVVHPLVAVHLRSGLADAALGSFYSPVKDSLLATYRPRKINRIRYQDEANQWAAFGKEQSRAERFEVIAEP